MTDKIPSYDEMRAKIKEEIKTSPKHAKFRRDFRIDAVIGFLLLSAGAILIGLFSHPLVALGVFLLLWAQNICRSAGQRKKKKTPEEENPDDA